MFKHSGQTQTPFKCKDTVPLFWWTLSASGEDSSALAAALGSPVSYAGMMLRHHSRPLHPAPEEQRSTRPRWILGECAP